MSRVAIMQIQLAAVEKFENDPKAAERVGTVQFQVDHGQCLLPLATNQKYFLEKRTARRQNQLVRVDFILRNQFAVVLCGCCSGTAMFRLRTTGIDFDQAIAQKVHVPELFGILEEPATVRAVDQAGPGILRSHDYFSGGEVFRSSGTSRR